MHALQAFTIALMSVSIASASPVSAPGQPAIRNSKNGEVLNNREAASLPTLTSEQKKELLKLLDVYDGINEVMDFANAVSQAAPGKTLQTLAEKLGGGPTAGNVRGILNKLPGQPQKVIFSYLIGIGECLFNGKSLSDSVECGKQKVRDLGPNQVDKAPKLCNNRLGQLELFGTGWPAPCHDPEVIEHQQGNNIKRAIKWGLCEFFSLIEGTRFQEIQAQDGQTCDKRFPTDAQIKDDLCKKYFGGSPCGASLPLNNEADFKKVAELQQQYKEYLASFEPQAGYEAVLGVQKEMPSLFRGPNAISLSGETCQGDKCSEWCSRGKCYPMREVCEPACRPDKNEAGECNCGWDQFRFECNSCRVDECGKCKLETITEEDGKFFAGAKPRQVHIECKSNSECYFVPI